MHTCFFLPFVFHMADDDETPRSLDLFKSTSLLAPIYTRPFLQLSSHHNRLDTIIHKLPKNNNNQPTTDTICARLRTRTFDLPAKCIPHVSLIASRSTFIYQNQSTTSTTSPFQIKTPSIIALIHIRKPFYPTKSNIQKDG